jgi:hypothetical protein
MNAMKFSGCLIAFAAVTISSGAGWAASSTAPGGPAAGQTTRALPTARYSKSIRTPNGRVVIVVNSSSVPNGAVKVDILGVPGRPNRASCTNFGNPPDYYDCYDCGNQTIDDSTPYRGACDYIGFCTSGYNGNSSYCSF